MPMPEWLHRLLETKTGGFRAARWQRCPKCDRITLHGMDADILAGMVTVDPTPINRQQEIWCALNNRPTYSLRIDADRKIEINDRPRQALGLEFRDPIVPEHQCGSEYPGFLDLPAKHGANTAGQEPPF
jgi:hypothetical protein